MLWDEPCVDFMVVLELPKRKDPIHSTGGFSHGRVCTLEFAQPCEIPQYEEKDGQVGIFWVPIFRTNRLGEGLAKFFHIKNADINQQVAQSRRTHSCSRVCWRLFLGLGHGHGDNILIGKMMWTMDIDCNSSLPKSIVNTIGRTTCSKNADPAQSGQLRGHLEDGSSLVFLAFWTYCRLTNMWASLFLLQPTRKIWPYTTGSCVGTNLRRSQSSQVTLW